MGTLRGVVSAADAMLRSAASDGETTARRGGSGLILMYQNSNLAPWLEVRQNNLFIYLFITKRRCGFFCFMPFSLGTRRRIADIKLLPKADEIKKGRLNSNPITPI